MLDVSTVWHMSWDIRPPRTHSSCVHTIHNDTDSQSRMKTRADRAHDYTVDYVLLLVYYVISEMSIARQQLTVHASRA